MGKFHYSENFRHSGESRNPVERESRCHFRKIPAFAGMTDLLGGWLQ